MFERRAILSYASLPKEGLIWISTCHSGSVHHGGGGDLQMCASCKLTWNRQRPRICSLGKHPSWLVGFYEGRIKGLQRRPTGGVEWSCHAVGKCLKSTEISECAAQSDIESVVAVSNPNLWCYQSFASVDCDFCNSEACFYTHPFWRPPHPHPLPFPRQPFAAPPCLCRMSAPVFLTFLSSGNCHTFCVLTGEMRRRAWTGARWRHP